MKFMSSIRYLMLLAAAVLLGTATVHVQSGIRLTDPRPKSDLENLPGDLRAVPVPGPGNLNEFVKDPASALALGKALFWDMQVGSDGIQACASCHFRAGADPRSKNQLSPGLLKMKKPEEPNQDLVSVPDFTFKTSTGVNAQLVETDFPLTELAIPGTRGALNSATDSDDVVSSQGVHHLMDQTDPQGFSLNGINSRRVEPRNTPTVINAVFNHRQFWDGRAHNVFNGVNHLGTRDPHATLFVANDPRILEEVSVAIPNSSLASQAVAPIVSTMEMAAPGRTGLDVGRDLARTSRKILKKIPNLRPLAGQQVHPEDSVLGLLSRWPQPGITPRSYDEMVRRAFHQRWWRSNLLIRVAEDGTKTPVEREDNDPSTDEYTLIQYNFSLFFGLAIQIYEATLVSDDSPWDRFRREHPDWGDPNLSPWVNTNPNHISRQALFGAHLFNDRARGALNIRCSNCHESAELTDASVGRIAKAAFGPIRVRDGNLIDKGFNNIGVRPTGDDLGVGGRDGVGELSFTRQLFPGAPPPTYDVNDAPVTKGFGVQGAFKIPSLRNVALTAPYFHNGDVRTLREVMEFYSRGGNVWPIHTLEDVLVEPLGVPNLSEPEKDALVAFMEALTDERVLYRRAPFDHPQLFVPNGHVEDGTSLADLNRDGRADDLMVEIPAVGARGGAPLPGFLEGVFGPRSP